MLDDVLLPGGAWRVQPGSVRVAQDLRIIHLVIPFTNCIFVARRTFVAFVCYEFQRADIRVDRPTVSTANG